MHTALEIVAMNPTVLFVSYVARARLCHTVYVWENHYVIILFSHFFLQTSWKTRMHHFTQHKSLIFIHNIL